METTDAPSTIKGKGVVDLGITATHSMTGFHSWNVHEVSCEWPPVELATGSRRWGGPAASSTARRLYRLGFRYRYGYVAPDGSRRAVLSRMEDA